jgi:hypothetical protein
MRGSNDIKQASRGTGVDSCESCRSGVAEVRPGVQSEQPEETGGI